MGSVGESEYVQSILSEILKELFLKKTEKNLGVRVV